MNHKTLISEGRIVHYWLEGQSEQTVVFTHGATMDHGLFRFQVEHFAQRYRVITWDAPAHGLSRPYTDFSLQAAANELFHILDAEEIEAAHLVGQSMGGYIHQIAAYQQNERFRSIAAVDSSPVQPSYYSSLDKWLLSITPPLLRLYPYRALVSTIASQIALPGESRQYALQTLQTYTKAEIADIMEAVYRGVIECDRDDPLLVPVLVVYGEADRTGKVAAYSRQWAQRENRKFVIIPNARHNANMDNPAAFNRVLEEFLESMS